MPEPAFQGFGLGGRGFGPRRRVAVLATAYQGNQRLGALAFLDKLDPAREPVHVAADDPTHDLRTVTSDSGLDVHRTQKTRCFGVEVKLIVLGNDSGVHGADPDWVEPLE